MATIKHISSKNADYGAAEAYLTFEHDEFTMKPTLDEAGRLIPRQDYRLDTLNCGEEDFALSCIRANLRYGKNSKREDIKSHHYIISFDPRDAADNGLTVDRAQATAKSIFPDTKPLSVPTRTGTTIAAISMCILSSTVCGLPRWSASPTWTGQATPEPGTSTAVPQPPCGISAAKSWRCATGRGFTRSTS